MLDFLTLKPEAFGIDISDLSIKAVKLKKKKGFLSLASFCEEKIKPGIIKEGEIRDEEALVRIIKESLSKVKGERLKSEYAIVSLPEEKAFLQVIQMPKIPEEDIKSAVIYEAENYIPLPLEEVYLDSQVILPFHNHLDHFDVLIAALPRKIVDPYLLCLRKAGFRPKALEIESSAIARALVKNEVSPFPLLLIDLGATRTSFIIFSGYSVRFTTSISVSSRIFTEIISQNLNIDLKEAEKIKTRYGIKGEGRNGESRKVLESLTPILSDLAKEIKKYISYYQTHTSHEHLLSEGQEVRKVFLSGGGANLKGLTDFLSRELKIPVTLGNPWTNILSEPLERIPQLTFEESLRYTTALGLALRGVKV